MITRRVAVHIFIVAVIIALTGLAILLDWGPVVHSAESVLACLDAGKHRSADRPAMLDEPNSSR